MITAGWRRADGHDADRTRAGATRRARIRRRTRAGFSLIELLVAVALLAVLATLAHAGLRETLRAGEQSGAAAERLASVQRALALLARELQAAAARPVTGTDGAQLAAFAGSEDGLEFSTVAAPSVSAAPGPAAADAGLAAGLRVQRVQYRFEAGALSRQRWPVLDRAADSEPLPPRSLLEGLQGARLRYLGAAGGWTSRWPAAANAGDGGRAALDLPRAVELHVDVAGLGAVRRLWQVGG